MYKSLDINFISIKKKKWRCVETASNEQIEFLEVLQNFDKAPEISWFVMQFPVFFGTSCNCQEYHLGCCPAAVHEGAKDLLPAAVHEGAS